MSLLLGIKDSVQNIAKVIASILNIEVCIVDEDLLVIGGTAKYKKLIGNILQTSFAYKSVIKSKKHLVMTNPGENEICIPCELYKKCPEMAEMDCPIIIDDKVIGIVSLVAFNEEQFKQFMGKKDNLFSFIQGLIDLIISKVKEKQQTEQLLLFAKKIEAITDSVHEGILALDEKANIIHINPSAEDLLCIRKEYYLDKHIKNLIHDGKKLEEIKNGTEFNDLDMFFNVNGEKVRVLCTARHLSSNKAKKGVVLTLRSFNEFSKIAYKMIDSGRNYTFNDILGSSPAIENVKEQAIKAARSNSTILIRGESGTGKEMFARAIHSESLRTEGPFITLNCAAIPESLLESELFGYEGGAFTGAKRDGKPGKFKLASGGTIFLDEIGDMTLYLQAKLLRVLEEKEIEPVGGIKTIPIDVRIIAATNRDLEDMIAKGEFRDDLYYRLNVIPLHIPPLRERKQDINILVDTFMTKYTKLLRKNIKGMNIETRKKIEAYPWPGNVRELENVVEYAVNMCSEDVISDDHLPERVLQNVKEIYNQEHIPELGHNIKLLSDKLEKRIIIDTINKLGNNTKAKEKAAEMLGISLSTLYRRLRE
jgi:transcriptional regulator with PAS, ATPase and Fis domain